MVISMFKWLGKRGDMNGMGFIPIELLDEEPLDSQNRLQYSVRVVRPRVNGINVYSIEDIK